MQKLFCAIAFFLFAAFAHAEESTRSFHCGVGIQTWPGFNYTLPSFSPFQKDFTGKVEHIDKSYLQDGYTVDTVNSALTTIDVGNDLSIVTEVTWTGTTYFESSDTLPASFSILSARLQLNTSDGVQVLQTKQFRTDSWEKAGTNEDRQSLLSKVDLSDPRVLSAIVNGGVIQKDSRFIDFFSTSAIEAAAKKFPELTSLPLEYSLECQTAK